MTNWEIFEFLVGITCLTLLVNIQERIMAKKQIQGKNRRKTTKAMSHTGGNSRPLKDIYFDEVSHKWFKRPIKIEEA